MCLLPNLLNLVEILTVWYAKQGIEAGKFSLHNKPMVSPLRFHEKISPQEMTDC